MCFRMFQILERSYDVYTAYYVAALHDYIFQSDCRNIYPKQDK